MQPGYYGQPSPMMGGTPGMEMPYGGSPFMPGMGMPYGPTPFTPGMGMPCGPMPFTPGMEMPYGGMPYTPGMGMPYGGMPTAPYTGTFTAPFGAVHCPVCGYGGPTWHAGAMPDLGYAGAFGGYPAWSGFGGLGGLRRHGGSYTPQFTATGLPTDEEITEMIYDTMDVDPLIPYDANIEIDCDAGVVTLSGTVPNKRAKHAAGNDAWWVPGVVDVKNEIQIGGRRRARTAPPETEERKTR